MYKFNKESDEQLLYVACLDSAAQCIENREEVYSEWPWNQRQMGHFSNNANTTFLLFLVLERLK